LVNEEEEKNRKADRAGCRAEREKRVFVPKTQLCANGLSERFKMAKRLRCEALAKTTCEPEDKREKRREEEEGGGGGAREGQSGKSELVLTAREAELLDLLAVREVESFSHISNNHSARLSPRRPSSIREIERTNAFAKSTSSPGSRPPPLRAK